MAPRKPVNIITWMYTHPPGDNPYYPQSFPVDEDAGQHAYWRCVFSLFHSSTLHNTAIDKRHILYCNMPPPAFIDDVSIQKMIDQNFVVPLLFEPKTKIPAEYHEMWRSQFYMIDLFEDLAARIDRGELGEDEYFLILDSDCLFNHAIGDDLLQDIIDHKLLCYHGTDSIHYPDEVHHADMTLKDLADLCGEYLGKPFPCFYLCGGELYGGRGDMIKLFAKEGRRLLEQSLERFHAGMQKFVSEEQLFSCIISDHELLGGRNDKHIMRIWTNPEWTYADAARDFSDKALWHIPSEKNRFFVEYFRSLRPLY